MKVKCSGTQPCTRCDRKKKPCHFLVEDKRVSVPESYLRELQQRHSSTITDSGQYTAARSRTGSFQGNIQAPGMNHPVLSPNAHVVASEGLAANGNPNENPKQPSEGEFHRDNSHSTNEGVGSVFQQNPLADNDYTFAKANGRYWYMGPSSSWSFCRRVLALIGKHVPGASCLPDPWHFDGSAFKMQWKPLGLDETPDTSNLPPLDYAIFLFNTAKFYLGPIFFLIDEKEYLQNLHELYEDATAKVRSSRLWFAQYLLILAFGKAFVVQNHSQEGPAGYQYAIRAMALLPDLSGMNREPLYSIQGLTLAALYFQSVDMRVAAFQHIGQALRVCIIEGIHRHMPEDVVGAEHSQRCGIIFWVVYMLDREFAAQIGAPSSIRDEDITAKLPSQNSDSLNSQSMTLHVRLSRLMAQILATVYGVKKGSHESLVKHTQSILRDLAELSKDLTGLLNTHFQGSVSRASRMALRLILSYHHCVVLTTRPLVMCALHMHIERPEGQAAQTISLSPPVASLMQSCVDSAQTVLHILRALGDEELLEAFLPFQLEDAFSSAFLLHLIRVVAPSLLQDDSWCDNIQSILNTMISKGSLVAPLRKAELSQLEHIMAPLTPGAMHLTTPTSLNNAQQDSVAETMPTQDMGEHGWDVFDANMGVMLSPRELLDLAEQLDMESLIHSVTL
ncbi:hypothetical protein ASPWEDRAFT_108361 [Aspergillus wentii DTO 134E9]|uniref:Xylanolytic transcriptional activator regulatory domain-containing protein n=1 Tax=Aspergillus wentii DTO 134E9 TaxID=1073089 RepID=A0A1L9RP42_ASPWE|nr:uncharacterized protein ASPWEDRAFT_108361 [Aspergillus wentii DTO 134E9]OJJ36607.1 hypothetical protein ASPWEDRAFT_108361 [Aspergillus wentii DTO 134E9]